MPRGITETQVFVAADALLARGDRPTVDRIRLALGRGSPNTVNRMLHVWWRGLASRVNERPGSAEPGNNLEASLAEVEASAGAVARARARLAAERIQLEADCDEVIKLVASLREALAEKSKIASGATKRANLLEAEASDRRQARLFE